jgi:radical S-adenosyl methionine domain-containing protein 2
VFQCLLLEGENAGAEALRHAEDFYVTDEQFQSFLERHKHIPSLVPESNVKVTIYSFSILYLNL